MSRLATPATVAPALLAWYDRRARRLPWRAPPGSPPMDAYRVWLSEVMLQQTTVAAVIPYYERFLALWPTVFALAAAPVEDVLRAWAGLGYYARARNLHACARVLAAEHEGRFPDTEAALRALPGVGAYTAAAIAAIAFDRPAVVVDSNVERVVARLGACDVPLPSARALLRARAAELTPANRPGDYAQAMMDLGATVCAPRAPDCGACPLRPGCRAAESGVPGRYPLRAPRAAKPQRVGHVYWLEAAGAVLLVRRPSRGLLGGLLALPTGDWTPGPAPDPVSRAPAPADWRPAGVSVTHAFTHFDLMLEIWAARLTERPAVAGAHWLPTAELPAAGLPTLMRKVVLAMQARNHSLFAAF